MSGEPVRARPVGAADKAWRWCRRKPALAGAIAACALILVSGVVGITWQWRRAEENAARSKQVAQFLKDMLEGVGPSVARGRDTAILREILDKAVKRLGKELNNQPAVEADLREIIGNVYLELGDYAPAEAMFRVVLTQRRKVFGNEHLDVATAIDNLAVALDEQGNYGEAELRHREALAMRKKLLGEEHLDVATSLNSLAALFCTQGKYVEAEDIARKALAMRKKLLGDLHEDVAATLCNLATALSGQGKLAEAEALDREALAIYRKLFGDEHPSVAQVLNNLAVQLNQQGKHGQAELSAREALVLRKKLLGDEHPKVAISLANLAASLDKQGKDDQAEALYREALAMGRKPFGNEHPQLAATLNNLAALLSRQGRHPEAEPLLREALAMQRKLLGNEHPQLATALNNLAVLLGRQGRYPEAEPLHREALAMQRKLLGTEHWAVRHSLDKLVDVLSKQGKYAEADQLFDDLPLLAAEIQPQQVARLRLRGSFRGRRGCFAEAAADFTRVIEFKPDDYDAWHLLAAILVQNGQLDAYRQHCRKSLERFGETTDPLIATRMAKDCLILSDSGVELGAADAWAETSLTAGTNHPAWPALTSTKGVAEYRQGRFDSAVNWMEKTLASPKDSRAAWLDVETYAVLAMAHFQLKQIEEARRALAKGAEIEQADLPKLDSGDLGAGWVDWIIAHELLNEAKALVLHANEPLQQGKSADQK